MFKSPFELSFAQLPETIPVFPLDTVLLLPGGQVPLNIFELRYVQMTQDALASRDRMIGMVLPKQTPSSTSRKTNLYSVGCAGRITSFEETADGRFLVTLTGYCRFAIKQEIETIRGYRRMAVDWSDYEKDLTIQPNSEINRSLLLDKLKRYMGILSIDMDWGSVAQTPNFNLVTFFSMSLPFQLEQKQSLLECVSVEERADLLVTLIETELERSTSSS